MIIDDKPGDGNKIAVIKNEQRKREHGDDRVTNAEAVEDIYDDHIQRQQKINKKGRENGALVCVADAHLLRRRVNVEDQDGQEDHEQFKRKLPNLDEPEMVAGGDFPDQVIAEEDDKEFKEKHEDQHRKHQKRADPV